ncbi:hypothetical protein AWB79_04361 [Caballeronia hypogeia]|uniref:PPC domain-containing protein n=1 Tax=Caballeronia hypogeia TaxID=1777140 RepID=A0A158BWK0_9BURK|nr:DUF296 domain-containing protein [Caballeronia hypogeia]SAK74463.1 hypothetical protein AWB79_04361 [Caballeronia hypogeia]
MKADSRILKHPGAADPERIQSVAGEALTLTFELEPGQSLRDALLDPLRAAGIAAATVRMEGLSLDCLHFVRPAPPKDDQHVAFYSEPHRIDTPLYIELACATVGEREGKPFIHCHALWKGADGAMQGGHIFSDQVTVARGSVAKAWGIANALMRADYDPETNFTLFQPVEAPPVSNVTASRDGRKGIVARIRPNEDLSQGIEAACRINGIRAARIRGSVGSIVGARFENADPVDDIATEILVLDGEVKDEGGEPRATLDVALIDPRGRVHQGRVVRGDNPVLICFELFLEESLRADEGRVA